MPSSVFSKRYPELDCLGHPSVTSLSAKSELYHPTSGYGSYGAQSLSELPPRGILTGSGSGFDPRASYISDMESREFGSHVDMIHSLQLRSSLIEPGPSLDPGLLEPGLMSSDYPGPSLHHQPPSISDMMLKSDLDLSLSSMQPPREPLNVSFILQVFS